jgi:hypothetical protein
METVHDTDAVFDALVPTGCAPVGDASWTRAIRRRACQV